MAEKRSFEKKSIKPVNENVLKYFKRHPNEVIYSRDIAEEYDLFLGSVQTAVNKMSHDVTYRVFRGPARGTYIYRPNGPEKDLPADPTGLVMPSTEMRNYFPAKDEIAKKPETDIFVKPEIAPADAVILNEDYGEMVIEKANAPIELLPVEMQYDSGLSFVGYMRGKLLIRDRVDNELFVAIPLLEWLKGNN